MIVCSTSGDSSIGLSQGWPLFDGCVPLDRWPGGCASTASALAGQQVKDMLRRLTDRAPCGLTIL
jgi:hypothetical protein